MSSSLDEITSTDRVILNILCECESSTYEPVFHSMISFDFWHPGSTGINMDKFAPSCTRPIPRNAFSQERLFACNYNIVRVITPLSINRLCQQKQQAEGVFTSETGAFAYYATRYGWTQSRTRRCRRIAVYLCNHYHRASGVGDTNYALAATAVAHACLSILVSAAKHRISDTAIASYRNLISSVSYQLLVGKRRTL